MTEGQDWYGEGVATFGDRLAAARSAAGMSQKELAKRLGIRVASLRGWEDDVAEPRANRLSMIAGLLNVSVMWLINGEGEGPDAPLDSPSLDEAARDVLAEIAQTRAELKARADKLSVLEKRLRTLLLDDTHA
jgi:transcriptional regulator with XRE-family HTH domain